MIRGEHVKTTSLRAPSSSRYGRAQKGVSIVSLIITTGIESRIVENTLDHFLAPLVSVAAAIYEYISSTTTMFVCAVFEMREYVDGGRVKSNYKNMKQFIQL